MQYAILNILGFALYLMQLGHVDCVAQKVRQTINDNNRLAGLFFCKTSSIYVFLMMSAEKVLWGSRMVIQFGGSVGNFDFPRCLRSPTPATFLLRGFDAFGRMHFTLSLSTSLPARRESIGRLALEIGFGAALIANRPL